MYLAQLMHVAYVVLSVLAVYGVAGHLWRSSTTERTTFPATIAAVAAAVLPWLTLLALGLQRGRAAPVRDVGHRVGDRRDACAIPITPLMSPA